MLHQTLPFFFHFSPSSSSSPTLLSQVELEMECVAAKAFKTKFWPETTTPFKPNQSLVFEDFWGCGASNASNVGVVDEFLVDEFLDFSKDECDSQQHNQEQEQEQEQEEQEEQEDRDCVSVSSQEHKSNFAQGFSQETHLGTEFSVPTDDMAHLEWLSRFVDDSFSEFALPGSTVHPPQLPGSNRGEPAKPLTFPATQVPARPRTKRARTGSRVWPNTTAVTATATVTTATTTPTSSSASSSPSSSTSCLVFAAARPPSLEFLEWVGSTAVKRQRRHLTGESPRRCSHCGVQKTPQWRAGPMGAKTLCNACGVRFKSGRLLPEYRPACSPTFSSEIHSNSHRKVLEMRRKKEVAPLESDVVPAIQSF